MGGVGGRDGPARPVAAAGGGAVHGKGRVHMQAGSDAADVWQRHTIWAMQQMPDAPHTWLLHGAASQRTPRQAVCRWAGRAAAAVAATATPGRTVRCCTARRSKMSSTGWGQGNGRGSRTVPSPWRPRPSLMHSGGRCRPQDDDPPRPFIRVLGFGRPGTRRRPAGPNRP